MAIQSTTSIDQVITTSGSIPFGGGGTLVVSMFYNPAAQPGSSLVTELAELRSAVPTTIQVSWDSTVSAYEASFLKYDGSVVRNAGWPAGGYTTGQWYHLLAMFDGAADLSYLNGAQINDGGSRDITASTGHISVVGGVQAGQTPIGGKYANFAVWQGLSPALQDNEIQYLAGGGNPLSIRPAQASDLTEYLPLSTNTTDLGPHAYAQTTNGSPTFVADPAGLQSPQSSIFTPGKLTGASFRGGGGSTTNVQLYLFDALDANGTEWQFRACYMVSSLAQYIRDPHLCIISGCQWTAHNGEIWMSGGPNPNNGSGFALNTHKIELFKANANSYNFDSQVVLDTSAVTGTTTCCCFGPRMWIDPSTGQFHIFVGLSSDNFATMHIYETHPTATDWTNPANWSGFTQLTGTGWATRSFDNDMHYINGLYTLFVVDQSSFTYEEIVVMQSASLTSGWTRVKTGDWAGWDASAAGTGLEGQQLRQLPSGQWIAYLDNLGQGAYYSISTTSDPLGSWGPSAPLKVKQTNGLVNSLAPNFIMETFNTVVAVNPPTDMSDSTLFAFRKLPGSAVIF